MNLIANLLKNYQIILASQSPRRINLLKSLGLEFSVFPANINEQINSKNPLKYCKKLSFLKANFVAEQLKNPTVTINSDKNITHNEKIIIAADTIVVRSNEIINKPKNELEAFNILLKLSGNCHFVYTGITVMNCNSNKFITQYSRTAVHFRKLSDREIWNYIQSGSPMDKAGAYGIQDDYGALFVKKIDGCYNNVIGLPLELLFRMLQEIAEN